MAGGRGTRMKQSMGEKLLLPLDKKPLVLHVVDSLKGCNYFERVVAVTSPNSPNTKKCLEREGVEMLDTSGDGYVCDLNYILRHLDGNVFVAPGDLPLIDNYIIQKILQHCNVNDVWTSIVLSRTYLESLGLNMMARNDVFWRQGMMACCYSGVSIIDADAITSLDAVSETHVMINDRRLAFNLNTWDDYELLGTA